MGIDQDLSALLQPLCKLRMIEVIDRFFPVLDRIGFRHPAAAELFDLRKNELDPVCFFFLRAIPRERRHILSPGP